MDDQSLLLPLFEGLYQAPDGGGPWQRFLLAVLRRTGADRVRLRITGSAEPAPPRAEARVAAMPALEALAGAEAAALAGLAMASLRRGRVYALEELRALPAAPGRAGQDAELAQARIGDLRALRIDSPQGLAASLVLLAEGAGVLRAADAALLAGIAPALASALEQALRLARLESRALAAEASLARLGITQVLSEAEDPPPAPHCRLGEDGGVLLRGLPASAPAALAGATTVAIRRGPRPAATPESLRLLAAVHGLSPREAELADLISRGRSLAEAACQLGLSEASARVYSKRVFAKAGASGQPDLTRRVLEGLSALA